MSAPRPVDRPVPPEWAARLAEVSPKQDGLAWLHLAWEPGEVATVTHTLPDGRTVTDTFDQRVERYVLWQVQPIQYVPAAIVAELQGPHPRSKGMWRPYRRPDGTRGALWTGGPCGRVTRQQWELYRVTGGYAEPWWVIQGDHGGHRVVLSPPEKALYAATWGVDQQAVAVPRMGALPYAPFDERVVEAIQQHDTLTTMADMTGLGSRYGELMLRHYAALEAEARAKAYDGVYTAMADEMADELRFALSRDDPAWRRVVTDEPDRFDADAAREAFVAGTTAFADGGVQTINHSR